MKNNFYSEKKQIENWLNKYKITNYRLIPDEHYNYVIDVNQIVALDGKNFTSIPVKFNVVEKSFYCMFNRLTSLEFAPTIVKGDFNCSDNLLVSLEFCPREVHESFWCARNNIASLEFCPEKLNGIFSCEDNPRLKELQKIIKFSDIYKEHLIIRDKIKLKDKLNNELIEKPTIRRNKI